MMSQNNNNASLFNMIAAIILSALILFAWNYFYEEPKSLISKQEAVQSSLQKDTKISSNDSNNINNDYITSDPQDFNLEDNSPKFVEIIANSDDKYAFSGSINLLGARFDNIILNGFKSTIKNDSTPIETLVKSTFNTQNIKDYFVEFGMISNDNKLILPDKSSVWKLKKTSPKILTAESPITIYWVSPQSIEFIQNISIIDNYLLEVEYEVMNHSNNQINLQPFARIFKHVNIKNKDFDAQSDKISLNLNQKIIDLKYKKVKKNQLITYPNTPPWFSMSTKYWLTSIMLEEEVSQKSFTNVRYLGSDNYQIDIIKNSRIISPNKRETFKYKLFVGAKVSSLLKQYESDYNLPSFSRIIDFGMLYFIAEPIFDGLLFLYKLIGNMGWSIILLTLILKLFLFPFANRSYMEMNKMKKIRPEIDKLTKKYSDNKLLKNQKVLELHKKYNLRPMLGCLPVLLQIPIFLALYKVLLISIELRHAPFIGWITDLSAKDNSSLFNLFGLFSYEIPDFFQIGLLPIITTITMIMQNKLNPQPSDPMQARIFALLPYFLLIIFINLPSGLLLYWIISNSVSIIQQYIISKVHADDALVSQKSK